MVISLKETYRNPFSWVYLMLLVFAGMQQFLHPKELMDTLEYKSSVQYWFNSDSIKLNPYLGRWMYVTRRTVGYPLLMKIFGDWGIQILGLVSAIISPAILIAIFKNRATKIRENCFWLFWLTQPLQFFYSALPMPEIISQLLLCCWLLFFLKKQSFKSGLILSFLILIKPIFIVLLGPITILLILKFFGNYRFTERFRFLNQISFNGYNPTALLIPIGFIIIVGFYNLSKWGVLHLSSISTTNFYEYNRYQTLKEARGTAFTDSLYQMESVQLNSISDFDPEKGNLLKSLSASTILRYPTSYLKLHAKGMLQMFIDPGRYDAMVFLDWPQTNGFLGLKNGHPNAKSRPTYEWLYIFIFAFFNLVKFAIFIWAIFNVIRVRSKEYAHLLFLCSIMLVYAFAIGSVGTARYLIPVYPIMAYISIHFISHRKSQHENSIIER